MEPKTAVNVALARRGMSQAELARILDLEPQALSRGLSKSMVNARSIWPAVLEALDLEVVVQERRPTLTRTTAVTLIPQAWDDLQTVLSALEAAGYELAELKAAAEQRSPVIYAPLEQFYRTIDDQSPAWAKVPLREKNLLAQLVFYVRNQRLGKPAPYEPSGATKIRFS
jgi:transcriptional regulator with XRE-family HTH domain